MGGWHLAAAVTLLRGRWKVLVLWYVNHDIDRFASLKRAIPPSARR